ncbi:MAG: DUF2867 domain-containing protein [Candidatus Omnitrophica bacterium]|nr:DUF2867 domain-containing protein [Candidatus Omnitrophota bacterium]
MSQREIHKILVLGATGYVGGRLVPKLLSLGYQVRATGRSIEKLKSRPWSRHPNVELFAVDIFNRDSLDDVLTGVDAAYYLVHSMNSSSKDFADEDRIAAQNMRDLSHQNGVKRIIYLGGLGESQHGLSKHLKSRHEVGAILESGNVPVTTLRAAMIIGSGSASFEILRYLVDRLPIMITPKWVRTKNQPIAIRNVIEYLAGCLASDETIGRQFDIGGDEILNYQELMDIYADEAGLPKRMVIPVPVLTPGLSSRWINLVTPVPGYIARPLTEGLVNEVVCHNHLIRDLIPQKMLSIREAIHLALQLIQKEEIETYWADSGLVPVFASAIEGDPQWSGGTLFEDRRKISINANIKNVWCVIKRVGGKTGWYHADWLWSIRGYIDKLCGGVGLRRGRRDPNQISTGDVLDFWRVISVRECQHLRLLAEMKLPGLAILEFRLEKENEDTSHLEICAKFKPKGLWGIIYWHMLLLFHEYIFGGMIKKIKHAAEKNGSNHSKTIFESAAI